MVPPHITRKAVIVFAADHGVTAEGVSAYPQEVTAQMVHNFLRGGAAINALARQAGAEVRVVYIGVAGAFPPLPGLLTRKVRPGTANIHVRRAMSRAEAQQCLELALRWRSNASVTGSRWWRQVTWELAIHSQQCPGGAVYWHTGRGGHWLWYGY